MKIEGKKSRVTQFPPHLHLPVCQPSSSNEFTFSDLPFLAHTPIEALFIILCIYCKFSSIHILAFLIPSLHNWAVPLHSSYDVPASTACVLPFCPLVWPAGFDSSVLVSCLPFLISYTRGLRALALYGKCLKVVPALFCSLKDVSQGIILLNSLKSWKFGFLKFRILTLVFAWPLGLQTPVA